MIILSISSNKINLKKEISELSIILIIEESVFNST